MNMVWRKLIINKIISFFIFVSLVSCVGPAPRSEMSLANVALESARESNAAKHAPGLFRQAEDLYRQALSEYEEKNYQAASENFLRAKQFAEKAENYTVLKKAESGVSE